MKFQKITFFLVFTLLTLTSLMASNEHELPICDKIESTLQLNSIMSTKLKLTNNQLTIISRLNKRYWISRTNIMNASNIVGRNTALLACWDEWRLSLYEHLTSNQMEKFIEWQSQVDLLGERPF